MKTDHLQEGGHLIGGHLTGVQLYIPQEFE